MYKNFYFLHIDKTISKTAGIRMFDPLYEILDSYGINAKSLNSNHNSHNRWRNLDNDTFIFCVVRDPVERSLSDFWKYANYNPDGSRTHIKGRDEECPFYTEQNIKEWIDNHCISNYQSKVISNWGTEEELKNNISRINLLIRAEDISGNENVLRNMILSNFNIKYDFAKYNPDFDKVFMSHGTALNNLLLNNQWVQNSLQEKNQQDYWVYHQAQGIDSSNFLNTES
jgi:hypothetical protein